MGVCKCLRRFYQQPCQYPMALQPEISGVPWWNHTQALGALRGSEERPYRSLKVLQRVLVNARDYLWQV